MSLCGSLNNPSESIAEKFLQHQITFDDLANNPKIFEEPNLVVRYDGQYYNWKTAAPLIMSLLVFRRPLPQVSIITCPGYLINYLTNLFELLKNRNLDLDRRIL